MTLFEDDHTRRIKAYRNELKRLGAWKDSPNEEADNEIKGLAKIPAVQEILTKWEHDRAAIENFRSRNAQLNTKIQTMQLTAIEWARENMDLTDNTVPAFMVAMQIPEEMWPRVEATVVITVRVEVPYFGGYKEACNDTGLDGKIREWAIENAQEGESDVQIHPY